MLLYKLNWTKCRALAERVTRINKCRASTKRAVVWIFSISIPLKNILWWLFSLTNDTEQFSKSSHMKSYLLIVRGLNYLNFLKSVLQFIMERHLLCSFFRSSLSLSTFCHSPAHWFPPSHFLFLLLFLFSLSLFISLPLSIFLPLFHIAKIRWRHFFFVNLS